MQKDDLEWKDKVARLNFKNMSLHARAMQNAGFEDELMTDTLRKSDGVITTLSKTADNKLKEGKKPVVALIGRSLPVYGVGVSLSVGT